MMHVLFVIDPLVGLKAYKDTSVAMMKALVARRHSISVCHQGDLYIDEGRMMARTQAITLHPHADLHGHTWWEPATNSVEQALSAFSAVVMRKDPR